MRVCYPSGNHSTTVADAPSDAPIQHFPSVCPFPDLALPPSLPPTPPSSLHYSPVSTSLAVTFRRELAPEGTTSRTTLGVASTYIVADEVPAFNDRKCGLLVPRQSAQPHNLKT
ncbi:unnamed protein product [Dibothriocephalus latus]|uniref:Uncharacterized protein n=1 Tax=Dibothriocephalus latus TaxID=60516 RepID=A0A3P7MFT1_DIBLA|nr:unnamed protein product [Dibothriocephalus latus]